MHREYLLKALALAEVRRGYCFPNPSVGALVVDRDGKVLAESYHQRVGSSHAEAAALKQLNYPLTGAKLYVTLEPCSHFGRTPPCVDEIIRSHVSEVIFGYKDPNPKVVQANTTEKLRAHGIACHYVPIDEIDAFYQSYYHWTLNKRPFVTAKMAQSFDGRIANSHGQPFQLTGEKANQLTHRLRKQSDILLTTAKTVNADDPALNVRQEDRIEKKPLAIIDQNLTLNPEAKIFSTSECQTIFYRHGLCAPDNSETTSYIPIKRVNDKLSLTDIIAYLGETGCHDLWVEAGGQCFSQLLAEQLVDRVYLYISPLWLGRDKPLAYCGSDIFALSDKQTLRWQALGDDMVAVIDLNKDTL